MESVFNEMDCSSPVIYLLSAGADPTDSIEGLARKKKTDVACVSMGEVSHWNTCRNTAMHCMGLVRVGSNGFNPVKYACVQHVTSSESRVYSSETHNGILPLAVQHLRTLMRTLGHNSAFSSPLALAMGHTEGCELRRKRRCSKPSKWAGRLLEILV